MWFENKWIFFHCIKKKYPTKGFYSREFNCQKVDNILNVNLPKVGNEEYLIPLCGYIPKNWIPYYLNKHIANLVTVELLDSN